MKKVSILRSWFAGVPLFVDIYSLKHIGNTHPAVATATFAFFANSW